jgi:tetratricopeptide (TPR) repeat protein
MRDYHKQMTQHQAARTRVVALLLMAAVSAPVAAAAAADSAALRREAFALAYNLDHEQAIARLRQAVAENPSDPAAHRALASILWLHMLFVRGAVTVDHYLGSFSRTQVELSKPPAELDAEFRKHVARAIELAEARMRAAPRDAQAHYDLGAAVGLDASHIATVEGKMFAGFKAARRAYDAHEKVLELDPARKDAGLVVGTYRYVVSTLSLPLRMMAYAVGFGGGRERGIQTLSETSVAGDEARTDALFALVLIYNRERRYDQALQALNRLREMYPRNRLVVLEAGSTALRAGRAADADRLLSEGLTMLARDTRTRMPGEEALWRYKRGAARGALNQLDAARADLNAAVAPGAQDWVRGRANAELARLAIRTGDREGGRALALRAESLCQAGSDPACVNDAKDLVRSAGGR